MFLTTYQQMASMGVFDDILFRQYNQEAPLHYVTERDDGFLSINGAFNYFLPHDKFPKGEQNLLAQISGRTIELAAGAGRVSLYLQQHRDDVEITASDVSSQLLKLCQKRGIAKIMHLDLHEFRSWDDAEFDGLIDNFVIFGNSLGVIDNPEELAAFLQKLYGLTSADGMVVGDFRNALATTNPDHLNYHDKNRQEGKLPGWASFRVRIDKQIGDWIDLWMPSIEEFTQVIGQTDWQVELSGSNMVYFKLYKE